MSDPMTVGELIDQLSRFDRSMTVKLDTYYDEDDPSPLTGMLTDTHEIVLTDEELD